MAALAYRLTLLLEKLGSNDKDYRYMALNDLMIDLQNNTIKLEHDAEEKILAAVKRLVNDANCEVQNMAVKCLGTLITRISEDLACAILDDICTSIMQTNAEVASTSTTALKHMIAEFEQSNPPSVPKFIARIVPRLIAALDLNEVELCTRIEVIDMLKDIMSSYGKALFKSHSSLRAVLLSLLDCNRQSLRKKAISSLGSLMAIVNEELYESTMSKIFIELSANNMPVPALRTYTLVSQSICRLSGDRFERFLPSFVTLLLNFIERQIDEELTEICLQTFEVYLTSCRKEVSPYVESIITVVVNCLKYDPNYQDSNGLSQEKMEIAEQGEQLSEFDEDDDKSDFSDDEDSSWKIRRAAASCIEVLVLSRRQEVPTYLRILGPILLERFNERECIVKWDVMHAYLSLLVQAKSFFPSFTCLLADQTRNQEEVIILGDVPYLKNALSHEQVETLKTLNDQVPCLVSKLDQEMKTKVQKTLQSCFAILTSLVRTCPGALHNDFHSLLPVIRTALNDKSNSNMKITAIEFLGAILHTHRVEKLYEQFLQLVPVAVLAVNDPFYKVAVEALGLTNSIIRALVQAKSMMDLTHISIFVNSIFDAIFVKFDKMDLDHEVREKLISTMALLIANFSFLVEDKAMMCLPIFLNWLRNESTHLITVKSVHAIVDSQHRLNLSEFCSNLLPILSNFLRKNNRTLRISSLNLLDSLIRNYGDSCQVHLNDVVSKTPALLSDHDLHISQTTLEFLTDVARLYPHVLLNCLPELLIFFAKLIQSSLLRGSSLESAKKFLHALIHPNVEGMIKFSEILDYLSGPVYSGIQLQFTGYHNIASCVATVAEATRDFSACVNLADCLQTHSASDSTDNIRLFAVLSLGELGRYCPQTFVNNDMVRPEYIIYDAFNSSSEDLKTAASYALGSLAVGNLEKFLPFILSEIGREPKHQYLLLNSLKEVISAESASSRALDFFRPQIDQIWPVLLVHAVSAEEGTRNVVSECFGKLCLLEPQTLLPKLKETLESDNQLLRACAVASVKYVLIRNREDFDDILRIYLPYFLEAVKDEDMGVKRAALNALNSAAHNKPKLVRDILHNFLPALYEETLQKASLIREVEMGPFKHTVDDGIESRKAAFECMYTLLDSCLEKLDIFEFMHYMENGLKDSHQVKVLAYLMVFRLSLLCPSQILQRLNSICEHLITHLRAKAKMNAVKQEMEKIEELQRAALRALIIISRIPDSERNVKFGELLSFVRGHRNLNAMYSDVEKDAFRLTTEVYGNE